MKLAIVAACFMVSASLYAQTTSQPLPSSPLVPSPLVPSTLAPQYLAPRTSLSLDSLFSLVDRDNASLRTSRAAVDVASAGVDAAKAQRLPDITANLSASYLGNGFTTDRHFGDFTKAPIPHFGNNFALEASQVIYSGGALTADVDRARLTFQQSQIDVQQCSRQMHFLVLGEYLELFKLDNQIRVYHANIDLTRQLIDHVRARQQQGTALKNDITRYELQMEDLRLGLTKLTDARQVCNHQLCTVLGLPATETIVPDTTIVARSYARDGESSWQQSAALSSPDLKAAALRSDMARVQTRSARSELLPHVSLLAADHLDGPITIEVPPINRNFNYWYVGIGVRYSLSSLFKANRKVRQAQFAERQAADNRTAVAQKVENDVQSDYTSYLQSYVEWQTQCKSVELARQNYTVVRDRYDNQLALITDMLDAASVKLSAELQEVNARIGIVYAYYKLKYTSGNL